MTVNLRTNRDLYLFIAHLCKAHSENQRTLEDYLKALWRLASVERDEQALSLARFAELLEAALSFESSRWTPGTSTDPTSSSAWSRGRPSPSSWSRVRRTNSHGPAGPSA